MWIGRSPSAREARAARFAGVVDLAAELPTAQGAWSVHAVPVLDLTAPPPPALAQAAEAIERLRQRGPVLVCCALGFSRSACAAAAWLLATGRAASVDAALARVRAARTQAVLDDRHASALHALRSPSPP